MIQDSTDPNVFSLEVNKDPSLIGEHTLEIEVESVTYPSSISPKTINVPIVVQCTTEPLLVETWTTPEIWMPASYDD